MSRLEAVVASPAATERLARLEQRLTDHESRCEERLAEIRASSASTLKAVEGLKNRVWAIVLSLLAWALAQLWTANQGRISQLEAQQPAAVARAPLQFPSSTREDLNHV